MAEPLRLPGSRDVRATLSGSDAELVVVACPPHPQMGGDRRDGRLRAVADALDERSIACLRFDYGPWDGGRGETTDARSALAWARENFGTTGLFGYSFGGAVVLRAGTAETDDGTPPTAISLLAPAGTLSGEPTADAVDDIACPIQVLVGERDGTVDADAILERARERGHATDTLPADHFFAGQQDRIAEAVATFFAETL